MKFRSTRDPFAATYTGAQVIKQGLAPDGGLFVPESIPLLTFKELEALLPLSYPERAAAVLSKFLTDYSKDELLQDAAAAYSESAFPGGAAPLHALSDGLYTQELWHGPTAAFKDMALQMMPRLLSRALLKTGEKRTALILVATSGDTGKAALEGYKDIERVRILVFYPEDGVSTVQKLQMQTQTGKNVQVVAIKGNFDDAQTGVKKIFSDSEMACKLAERGYFLSSANSINWGRLAPQIVYYVSAYCDLLSKGKIKMGDTVNVTVPTGNFGNIFAAYLAKRMGLPLGKLVCASNKNHILTDFLRTGRYDRNRDFYLTMSPSMDILISSNLERLLYFTAGPEVTAAKMAELSATGAYTVDAKTKALIDENFCGYFADEENTALAIRDTFRDDRYLIDPHTAVGVHAARQYRQESGDLRPMIVASTASPYKFALDVCRSLGIEEKDPLRALAALSEKTQTEIPYPLRGIGDRPIRFTDVITPDAMSEVVLRNAT